MTAPLFTSVPFEGEAYNRRMDGETQAEADARTALKNPILEASLIFGNYDPVDIRGVKYEDLNGNGVDDSDPRFANVSFDLFKGIGTTAVFVTSTTTNGNGVFRFNDLAPGTYTVQESPTQDTNTDGIDDVGPWDGTDGQGLVLDTRVFEVVAESGSPLIQSGDWFNYVLGSIHGFKFRDYDRDSYWDSGDTYDRGGDNEPDLVEPPLEDIKFVLYRYEGSETFPYQPVSGVPFNVTTHQWSMAGMEFSNSKGEFWFLDLEPGTYTICEDLTGTDFEQTTNQVQCGPEINSTFDPDTFDPNAPDFSDIGVGPDGLTTWTIESRDELQWDDATTYEGIPSYVGDAYDRPMDTMAPFGQITPAGRICGPRLDGVEEYSLRSGAGRQLVDVR